MKIYAGIVLALASCAAMAQDFPFERMLDRKPTIVTGGSVLIKNARILTVTKGTIENGSVLVIGGKIAAVGKDVAAPAGVQVIDAKGQVVSPGIVDGHMHRGGDAINEGTDSITCEVRIEDVVNPNSKAIWQALASGETTGMLLHGSANCIGGQSLVIKLKYGKRASELKVPDAPRMVKFALGENVTRSGQSNSGGGPNANAAPQRFPRTRMGVQALYRRAFTEAREYGEAWKKWEAGGKQGPAPRRDLRLEALSDILDRKVWVQCHCYRADEELMMVRLSQEFGFKLGALQHALEAYKIAPELAQAGVGVSMFADEWAFKVEGYDAIAYNAALCTKAGVTVSINTDGTNGQTSLAIDAAKAMRYGGLSEDQAMAMLTINPAKLLGVDHRTGSIEVGKDGDLVIWDGHPLSVYSRPNMTLVEGEVYFQRRDAHGIDASSTLKTKLDGNRKTAPLSIPEDQKAYVIAGATIHPVSKPAFVGSIRMAGSKIEEVGEKVNTRDARVISGKGLHVYPGFIDGGNSIGLSEVPVIGQMVDTTELTDFGPQLMASTAVQVQSEQFPVVRNGGCLVSLTRPSGGTISGQASLIFNGGWTAEQMRVGADLLMVQFGGGGGGFPFAARCCDELGDVHEEELGGHEAEAPALAQGSSELQTYVDKAKAYAAKHDKTDLAMEAIQPYLNGKPMLLRVRTAAQIRSAAAFAKKNGLKVVLTGAADAWKEADLLAKEKIPVLIDVAGKSTLGADSPASDWDPYDTPRALPALLARKGVQFGFCSNDAPSAQNLGVRAGISCAYGLKPDDALRALTLSTAEILGVADQLGSLDAGKSATLFISDGDPFELTSNIVGVFINGRPMAMESRWTRLRDQWGKRTP